MGTLARVKINTPSETMTIEEMQMAFRELSGESLEECLHMVGGTGSRPARYQDMSKNEQVNIFMWQVYIATC